MNERGFTLEHQPKYELFKDRQEIKVINIGLELFVQALKEQEVKVIHVAWKPPADGDPELMKMLEQLL